jgi:hypothetical protein
VLGRVVVCTAAERNEGIMVSLSCSACKPQETSTFSNSQGAATWISASTCSGSIDGSLFLILSL